MILKSIRKAYKQHKGLTDFLVEYRRELEGIQDLIESVKNEKALKGAKVSEPLTSLKHLEGKLCDWLAKVDPGDKKSLRQFADQLLRGQDDRKKLDHIMKDLDRAKNNLLLALSMHHSTVVHSIGQAVDTKSNKTIRLSQNAKTNRSTTGRANIIVPTVASTDTQSSDSEEDDTSTEDTSSTGGTSTEGSESDEPTSAVPEERKIRRVRRNKAKKGSRMINGPVGKVDRYAHVSIIEIEDNECEEDADMINYAIDEEGLALTQKMREMRIAERRDDILWARKHGFEPCTTAAARTEASG